MNDHTFVQAVAEMRRLQKAYFREEPGATKRELLGLSKAQEKQVDALLKTVLRVESVEVDGKSVVKQTTMFDDIDHQIEPREEEKQEEEKEETA